jgi:hypothetical protein
VSSANQRSTRYSHELEVVNEVLHEARGARRPRPTNRYQDAISRIRFAAFGTERADAEALARVQAILRELDKGLR